jgi:hypothetical protein
MSYTTTRHALIALSAYAGQWVKVSAVRSASADLMGEPNTRFEVHADLKSMHDAGIVTVNGGTVRYDGLVLLAPSGRKYAVNTLDGWPIAEPIGNPDRHNDSRLPEHALELIPTMNGLHYT